MIGSIDKGAVLAGAAGVVIHACRLVLRRLRRERGRDEPPKTWDEFDAQQW